jgi:hypothetical protein
MEVIATAKMPWEATPVNTRGGKVSRKYLREAELLPGVGFYARLVKYHEGEGVFTAPRHKHNYDQIRFTVSGTQDFGQGQVCQANWPSYFPMGAPYGPERIEGAEAIVIQWGDTWVNKESNDAAVEAMTQVGEFKGGIYTRVDEDGTHHNTDSIQAIWEHVHQRPLEYPTPRYPQPILMNPDAFDWAPLTAALSVKNLGSFTERDVTIAAIRFDSDAKIELGPERTHLVFSTAGTLDVDGVEYPAQTAIWSDFGSTDSFSGLAGAEVVVFGLPRDLDSVKDAPQSAFATV